MDALHRLIPYLEEQELGKIEVKVLQQRI